MAELVALARAARPIEERLGIFVDYEPAGINLPFMDEGWQNDLLLLHTEAEEDRYAGGDDALAEQLLEEEAALAAADR